MRLFFDIEGAKLPPEGPVMREVPPLLLLHGGPGFDHSGFKSDFSQVANLPQVVYLDQRGVGRSDPSSVERWKLDQWADDIRAFCDALEIERPILMGQSFGGWVAMTYATRYPDHAQSWSSVALTRAQSVSIRSAAGWRGRPRSRFGPMRGGIRARTISPCACRYKRSGGCSPNFSPGVCETPSRRTSSSEAN
jgi:pimeloyl-ACP methyl ester carboxylesterase